MEWQAALAEALGGGELCRLNLAQCGPAGFERLDNSNLGMAGAGRQTGRTEAQHSYS